MEFSFTAVCKVTMNHKKGEAKSKHVLTEFFLEPSANLDKNRYVDRDGLPTQLAVKPLTACFIQGLVGNIHNAHEAGFWDSAEHLRYIIEQLEIGFKTVPNIGKGNMNF